MNQLVKGNDTKSINLAINGTVNERIPATIPIMVIGAMVHKTAAFMTGDNKLNCPKVAHKIGATPIWADREVEKS